MSQFETLPDSASLRQSAQAKVRFDYLDGLRGFAALYVVLFHIYMDMSVQLQAAEPQMLERVVEGLLSHGPSSVAIFIVLSGYCLMLPVARSIDYPLRGGVLSYLKRRAQRILPPYYAALFLAIVLNMLIPASLIHMAGYHWSIGQLALTRDAIVSHILLIHNFSQTSIYKINPPLWSVAFEWQIYFLFPLLLLPVLRRFGLITMLGASCIISVILHLFSIPHFWFVTLFALGMSGALIGFSKQLTLNLYKNKSFWNSLAIFGTACFIIVKIYGTKQGVSDFLLALTIVCLIISCSRSLIEGKSNTIRHFFESRWAITLGTFSYSLYLTHAMVLAIVEMCLYGISIAPILKLFLLIAIVVPLSVLFAYFFHLLFEKSFMTHIATNTTKEKRE